jgi:FkbM family methyltransferase
MELHKGMPRALYRRVRRMAWKLAERDIQFPVQVTVPTVRLGTEYGGWTICPSGLGASSIVYSVGIGRDISFDLGVIEAYGLSVYAFDPTPASIAWLKGQELPGKFRWQELGLAGRDGVAVLFPPENPEYISHTMMAQSARAGQGFPVQIRRLSTIMSDLRHAELDVLKMDIEGSEYEVLDDILASGVHVRQILVEFHHRFAGIGIEQTRRAVGRLNDAGYRIFSAADNGQEYGFILAH